GPDQGRRPFHDRGRQGAAEARPLGRQSQGSRGDRDRPAADGRL
ncbi:MAG: hypothetical protein AVDCRST_MAG88-3412, partial [uncultured Thermomicrobiales bacterium]